MCLYENGLITFCYQRVFLSFFAMYFLITLMVSKTINQILPNHTISSQSFILSAVSLNALAIGV